MEGQREVMRMLREEDLLEIGSFGKAYGREGALKLRVEEYYLPYLAKARFVFVDVDGGFVPYLIDWLEYTQPPRLKLEEFNSPEQALRVVARPLALLRKDVPLAALPASRLRYGFLQGYELIDDEQGFLGFVAEVRKYPEQEIAVLDLGKRGEALIPLHEQLMVKLDRENKQLIMRLPEGLV